MHPAYYNENNPYAAQWLRNLIAAGLIAAGDVDERDIRDVRPDDLKGYTQCHFFAGIGVWSYALRQAGWPDDREVWTGSCPCQPFSVAGMGSGFSDERHLWPFFHYLIEQRQPPVVLGEQVASKDGLAWLDLVQSDLEGTGYSTAAVDLCAAGVGAPHIRQRLWIVADSENLRCPPRGAVEQSFGDGTPWGKPQRLRDVGRLDDTHGQRFEMQRERIANEPEKPGAELPSDPVRPGSTNGLWRDADWLFCRDGKWRPVEPGTFPLAHGATARVGRLRAYGNAVNAEAAKEFILAYMGARSDFAAGLDLV